MLSLSACILNNMWVFSICTWGGWPCEINHVNNLGGEKLKGAVHSMWFKSWNDIAWAPFVCINCLGIVNSYGKYNFRMFLFLSLKKNACELPVLNVWQSYYVWMNMVGNLFILSSGLDGFHTSLFSQKRLHLKLSYEKTTR